MGLLLSSTLWEIEVDGGWGWDLDIRSITYILSDLLHVMLYNHIVCDQFRLLREV